MRRRTFESKRKGPTEIDKKLLRSPNCNGTIVRLLSQLSSRNWPTDFCGWLIVGLSGSCIRLLGFACIWQYLVCYLACHLANRISAWLLLPRYEPGRLPSRAEQLQSRLLCFALMCLGCCLNQLLPREQLADETNLALAITVSLLIVSSMIVSSRIYANMCTVFQATLSIAVGIIVGKNLGSPEFVRWLHSHGRNINVGVLSIVCFILGSEAMMRLENSELAQTGSVPKSDYIRVLDEIMKGEPSYIQKQNDLINRASEIDPNIRVNLEKRLKAEGSKTDGFVKLVRKLENRANDSFDTGLKLKQRSSTSWKNAAVPA